MHDKAAHTAEHAFIGSLQKLLGQTLEVRKVEHRQSGVNTAHIVIPSLDLDALFDAEKMTNLLIVEGKKVSTRTFDSLESAKREIPHLRANEERILGEVRVVEIEAHDAAACSMEHVENLSECLFFLLTRFSKSGREYEVDFTVGVDAKKQAIEISAKLLAACNLVGANSHTLLSTINRLKAERDENFRKLKSLTHRILGEIAAEGINTKYGNASILFGAYSDLNDDQILEFAGEKVQTTSATIICVSNTCGNFARIVLARPESALIGIDMNEMFRRHAEGIGKGGGKPHFVTGVIPSDFGQLFIRRVVNELQNKQ